MSSDYDIIVAGGGIAGLSAGLAAARLGRSTLVLTGDVLGGNLLSIEKIEGYPGFPDGVPGYELCPIAQAQAADAGAEFSTTPLQRIDGQGPEFHIVTGEGEFSARAVIVATGSEIRTLGVPGEERLKGKGVSHCASCDAPLLRGSVVVVVGGGDSAMQEALTLAGHASRVIILHRGGALSGQASYRARVLAQSNIEVRYNAEVEEILGDDTVCGVRLRGAQEVVEASGVFMYIGLAPNSAFLGGRLRLDGSGRILTDSTMATGQAGFFAAGSVRSGWPGRASASAGEGTAAAVAAHTYLAERK